MDAPKHLGRIRGHGKRQINDWICDPRLDQSRANFIQPGKRPNLFSANVGRHASDQTVHSSDEGEGVKQLSLVTVPEPAQPAGIRLINCGVSELLESMTEAPALIIADPPWNYSQAPGHSANPDNHYSSMTDAEIVAVLDRAFDTMKSGRLALWLTWPKLQDWIDAVHGGTWRWRYVSGGAWTKVGGAPGTGFHWLGQSELVLVYVRGTGLCTKWGPLTNAHSSERRKHSEKPIDWMEQWIERWTEKNDLILDLFAGMAPVARACARTGRRYIGAEIDPERYRQAVDRLALDRGQ